MSRKEKRPEETAAEEQKAPETEEPVQTEQPAPESGEGEIDPLLAELEALKDQAAHQEDKYLRLAAEYDNYRRRTTKEKESSGTMPRRTLLRPSFRCMTTWSGP